MPFDNTNIPPAADHLMRAKAYLEEHGRARGWKDGDKICPVAALARTARWGDTGAWKLVTAAGFAGLGDFFRWQDAPERTDEDVYAAVDRAIDLAMQEAV